MPSSSRQPHYGTAISYVSPELGSPPAISSTALSERDRMNLSSEVFARLDEHWTRKDVLAHPFGPVHGRRASPVQYLQGIKASAQARPADVELGMLVGRRPAGLQQQSPAGNSNSSPGPKGASPVRAGRRAGLGSTLGVALPADMKFESLVGKGSPSPPRRRAAAPPPANLVHSAAYGQASLSVNSTSRVTSDHGQPQAGNQKRAQRLGMGKRWRSPQKAVLEAQPGVRDRP
jgi:hypothetical protein